MGREPYKNITSDKEPVQDRQSRGRGKRRKEKILEEATRKRFTAESSNRLRPRGTLAISSQHGGTFSRCAKGKQGQKLDDRVRDPHPYPHIRSP